MAVGSVVLDNNGGALESWRPRPHHEAEAPGPWILTTDADNLPSMSARALSALLRARHADTLPAGAMLAALPLETPRNASNRTAKATATLASFLEVDPDDSDKAMRWLARRGAPSFSPAAQHSGGPDDGGLVVFHSELYRVRRRAQRVASEVKG